MTAFMYFTKRNLNNYFRDLGAVFFSLLSMIILIFCMVVFLGDMNSNGIKEVVLGVNPLLDPETVSGNCSYFIRLWTIGSVLSINTVTITMMAIGSMVRDESERKILSFYVTPVKRSVLTIGYIFSAWLIAIITSAITLCVAELFLLICGNPLLTGLQLAKLMVLIALNALAFSCIGYLIALLVHSMSAWSAILTVVGTLIGFAAGCYMPIGGLASSVQTVLKFMPFLHGAGMMRSVCVESAIEKIFEGIPKAVLDEINIELGNTITFNDHTFVLSEQLLIFLVYVVVALVVAILITRKRKLKFG